jgi:biotin carboxylase
MSQERWLVAVGAGRWQVPGIRAARAAGLKVLAVDGQSGAPGLSLADDSLVVDIRNARLVIDSITARGIQPSGAIAFCSDAGMLTAAALREHFGLPGPKTDVLTGLINKGVQRRAWTKAGLPCPRWFVVKSARDVPAALADIDAKAILKPVDSAGSRGVTVIERGAPWEQAFETAMNVSISKEVIIESFITGLEHTVETFTSHGKTRVLAITSKKKVEGTNNTVASELSSARLDHAKRAEADDICSRALEALGYEDGPGHTEFLLTERHEIYLVETGGRGGGFMVADGLVPGVSGFDLATACALQAVGLEPPIPPQTKSRAAVLRFVPSKAGRITRIEGFGADDELPGVQSEVMVALHQEVSRAACDGDRMAYVLAIADDLDEAQKLADRKEQRIRITVE